MNFFLNNIRRLIFENINLFPILYNSLVGIKSISISINADI